MNTERTTCFLMANLGSELTRFFALRKRSNQEMAFASAQRALSIISQLSAREDIGGARQEVALLRMVIEDALSKSPEYRVTENELDRYFLPFAQKILQL